LCAHVRKILLSTGAEVVQYAYIVTLLKERMHEVCADESGAACDEVGGHGFSVGWQIRAARVAAL
jgi:hypothetical protein